MSVWIEDPGHDQRDRHRESGQLELHPRLRQRVVARENGGRATSAARRAARRGWLLEGRRPRGDGGAPPGPRVDDAAVRALRARRAGGAAARTGGRAHGARSLHLEASFRELNGGGPAGPRGPGHGNIHLAFWYYPEEDENASRHPQAPGRAGAASEADSGAPRLDAVEGHPGRPGGAPWRRFGKGQSCLDLARDLAGSVRGGPSDLRRTSAT